MSNKGAYNVLEKSILLWKSWLYFSVPRVFYIDLRMAHFMGWDQNADRVGLAGHYIVYVFYTLLNLQAYP